MDCFWSTDSHSYLSSNVRLRMRFNFPRKFGHNAYGHNTLPSMEHFFVFLSYERTMVMLT